MTFPRAIRGLVVGVAVLLLGLVTVSPVPPARAGSASITATRVSFNEIRVRGQGFTPGGRVDVLVYDWGYGGQIASAHPTASASSGGCGVFCYVGGAVTVTIPVGCGTSSTGLTVYAYDAGSARWSTVAEVPAFDFCAIVPK